MEAENGGVVSLYFGYLTLSGGWALEHFSARFRRDGGKWAFIFAMYIVIKP